VTFDAHANLASGVVSVAPTTPTAGLTMTVVPDVGVTVPTAPFTAVVFPAATAPSHANAEIVRVSVNASGVWTMTRTAEGSTSRAIQVGDVVYIGGVTAKTLTDIEAAVTAETARAQAAEGLLAKGLIPVALKTAGYPANANEFVPADATAGALVVTLPTAPADKTRIGVKKIDASTNLVTITRGGTDVFNKAGGSTSVSLTYANQGVQLQYVAATGIWYAVASDLGLTALDTRYDAIGAAASEAVTRAAADALLAPMSDTRLYTPSLRQPGVVPSIPVTQFQSGHGFTKASGTGQQADDTSDFIAGTQSLSITTLGDSSAYITQKASISPTINMTGKQLRVKFKVVGIANVADCSLYLSSDNGATNNFDQRIVNISNALTQPYMQDGEWVTYTINWLEWTVVGSPDRTAINFLKLRVQDNGLGPVTVHFQEIALELEPAAAVCTITFDDGYASTSTIAAPYMSQAGVRASAMIIRDLIGSSGTYMTLAQVKNLQDAYGWDVGAHSDTVAVHNASGTGSPPSGVSDAVLLADQQAIKNWLLTNGFRRHDYYAWPHGYFTPSQMSAARNLFSAIRGVCGDRGGQIGPQETYPPGDPYRLRSWLIAATNSVANVQAALTAAIANKSWLHLTFHQIVPSGATGGTQLNTAIFQGMIDAIVASGITVKTVAEVYESGVTAPTTSLAGEIARATAAEAQLQPLDADLTALAALTPSVTNGPLIWNGSGWSNAKIVDANVATGAAIAPAKIAGTALTAAGQAFTRAEETFDGWRATTPAIFAENYPRLLTFVGGAGTMVSGTLNVFAGPKLYAGDVVNGFSTPHGTASSGLTHAWWCLIDPATLAVVCKTADDTSAWPGFAVKRIAMGTPFTVTVTKNYYAGLVLVATTTVPQLRGLGGGSSVAIGEAAPTLNATSNTGLTDPTSLGSTVAALALATNRIFLPYVGID
jgi:hypothetical protein